MGKFIYLVKDGVSQKVEVLKETKGQYKLAKNISYITTLNKSELLCSKGYGFCYFALTLEEAQKKHDEAIQSAIERDRKYIDKIYQYKFYK